MCKGLSYLPSSCLEKYVSSCARSMSFIYEILNIFVICFLFFRANKMRVKFSHLAETYQK